MSLEVEATYEGGVLKLDMPLPLEDHERVTVTVKPIPILEGLWEYLNSRRKLRTELRVPRGMEWRELDESDCFSDSPSAGFQPS
jgi:predicted DNA-binding antitoxin AbrB/MazE fold protein